MGFFAALLAALRGGHTEILKKFIPMVEGFLPVSVWDYKQYSWGYGTKAAGPGLKITRDKAFALMQKELDYHYTVNKPKVKKKLSANQWAALISFSYNAGPGNAANIIQTINTGTPQEVVTRMKKYIYAGGVKNQGLVNRREKEANLYLNNSIGSNILYASLQPERVKGEITDYPY